MNSYVELTDEELVALLQKDELNAFKEIYKRYWKKLYAAAYQRLKDNETAQEVVQDFFTAFWIKRGQLKIDTLLANYLYKAISYQIIDQYRKEEVRNRHKALFKLNATEIDHSTENTLSTNDLKKVIDYEVSQLPVKCRSVYELSRNQYKTNKEIASYLAISEKTVENHLTKALKQLRLSLSHFMLYFL
ncbi:RNA polymerase sigma-70 factor, ECF subfamily [Chitinophaga sp. YR573]|uniref:RNA polymerase sigma-70 factor n=1 Tax=Chitinophaga sp. YR573 TaxID=1881040 RepID=UPI0008D638F8|nr:RNA polymerase sigma-70 factor [Chitinophaga sp. YR573]SEW25274.1 RNA polymerase sigma-70 factor, ECF subfamily [Chitinophaga sp. YR573]